MKKTKSSWERKEFKYGLLFAAPWIFGFLAFSVYPLVSSLYYSFTKFNAVTTPEWVGLQNFQDVFSDPLVWKSLLNTLFISFVSTPINLAVALLLACIVTKNFRGKGAVRTAFFLPSVIPMVAATMVWIWMFDPTYGYINNVLGWFGINGPAWLLDAKYTKWALVLMGTWNTGTIMLVCMAALQSVPKSYYITLRGPCICIPGDTQYHQLLPVLPAGLHYRYGKCRREGRKRGGRTGELDSDVPTVYFPQRVYIPEDGESVRHGVDSLHHRCYSDGYHDEGDEEGD